jgi:hypothetical protein
VKGDFDFDVRRDAASAFGEQSLTAGAILSFEGRTLLAHPEWIAEALKAQTKGWLSPNNPILIRGEARVLPLGWRGSSTVTG